MKSIILKIIIATISIVIYYGIQVLDQGTFAISLKSMSDLFNLINLAIFIIIVYFFVDINTKKQSVKIKIILFTVIYCSINAITVFTDFGFIHVSKARNSSASRACWKNIWVLQKAIYDYDLNFTAKINKLDIPLLIKEKYIEKELTKPEEDCSYYCFRDLDNKNIIFCIHHLLPYTQERIINGFQENNYSNIVSIPRELVYEIMKIKGIKDNSSPLLKKIYIAFDRNRSMLKSVFYIFLALFFPWALFPY